MTRNPESSSLTAPCDDDRPAEAQASDPLRAASRAAAPFLWPLHVASAMSESAATALGWYSAIFSGAMESALPVPEPGWTTRNRVALTLPTMRLRDFSSGSDGVPALICAPYALHGATIADFARGHSIVEALQTAGLSRIAITDWLSAEPHMREFSMDTYLADLNVAVDEMGPPVDLIGLCQGGWMALVYAARFPQKVRRLVLIGAPVDVRAAPSPLMQSVDELPLSAFENLVRLGEGRVLGRYALKLWGSGAAISDAAQVLQLSSGSSEKDALAQRLAAWHAWTLDLPGVYYLQVVRQVFKENQIAEGRFVALGRAIDLRQVHVPMYLLAGREDQIVAPEQLFAAARVTATPAGLIEKETASCGHLGLFLGAETIAGPWRRIAQWLSRDLRMALAS